MYGWWVRIWNFFGGFWEVIGNSFRILSEFFGNSWGIHWEFIWMFGWGIVIHECSRIFSEIPRKFFGMYVSFECLGVNFWAIYTKF